MRKYLHDMEDITHFLFMKPRCLAEKLKILNNASRGRITVLTGARQVGKTTLVQMVLPEYPLLRFDSIAEKCLRIIDSYSMDFQISQSRLG